MLNLGFDHAVALAAAGVVVQGREYAGERLLRIGIASLKKGRVVERITGGDDSLLMLPVLGESGRQISVGENAGVISFLSEDHAASSFLHTF